MVNIQTITLVWFLTLFITTHGFIPHPSVRFGGQAGDSRSLLLTIQISPTFLSGLTHTEITQLGFLRSLARFLFETKAINNYNHDDEYTIDQLYELMNPTWNNEKLHVQTYPLKSILDTILAENALVDFDRWTKKLSAAHFDSEAFANASRRIIKIRRISTYEFLFSIHLYFNI